MNRIKGSNGLKVFLAIIFLGVVTTAHAKKPKISILHCGVDEVTETMVYKAISVANPSRRGHGNHTVGSIESEGTGEFAENSDGIIEEVFVDYVRTGADCLLDGDNELPACDVNQGQEEGATCGTILGSAG